MQQRSRKTKRESLPLPPLAEPLPNDKEVAAAIGNRLRLRRVEFGLSQEALGNLVGVTFQQVQKYERGMNAISAVRLFQFAKLLHVDVGYFYTELLSSAEGMDDMQSILDSQQYKNRRTLEMMKGFNSVSVPVQKAIANLLSTVAKAPKGDDM